MSALVITSDARACSICKRPTERGQTAVRCARCNGKGER